MCFLQSQIQSQSKRQKNAHRLFQAAAATAAAEFVSVVGNNQKGGRRWKQIPSQTGTESTAGALWIIWWLQSCDEVLPSIKSAALGAYFTFTPQTLEGDD